MSNDEQLADALIPGSLKRYRSYHGEYGNKTYGEIKRLAAANPPDQKARRMKKLIEQAERLQNKQRKRGT